MTEEFDSVATLSLQRQAEIEIEQQSSLINIIYEQHSSDFKWLTASLLLLNSGAVAGILNSEFVSIYGKQTAGVFYLIGIVLAMSIGVASQLFARKSLAPMIEYRAFWVAVSQSQTFDAETEKRVSHKIHTSVKYAWIVPVLGWLSAIAFLLGSISAGLHLVEGHDTTARAQSKSAAQ